jgi:hypothetical protein
MMKALVVEDDVVCWQPALIRAVTAAGFEPIPSQEAGNAALMLEHVDIRLVILDWNLIAPGDLPSVTGEGIAAIAQEKSIPVIVISGALHDPDFLYKNKIKDAIDESHRLRSKYGVCEWLPKKRLEAELQLTPPLPTLIKIIRQVCTEASLNSSQDPPASKNSPGQIAAPLISPPYRIEVFSDQSAIPMVKIISQNNNEQSVQVRGGGTSNPYYSNILEELCDARENGDSIVSPQIIYQRIPEPTPTESMEDAVNGSVEAFKQWLVNNVVGKGNRKLIDKYLFSKVADVGYRLSFMVQVDIQEHSPENNL